MSLIATNTDNGGGNFVPAPAGQHQAVCVDVQDLGMVQREKKDGTKYHRHEIRFIFQIGARMEDGQRFIVTSKAYGLSMHPNSTLRPFLDAWRGQTYTDQEAGSGVDVGLLVGLNALLSVVHNQSSKGGTFANIASIMPWPAQWGAPMQAENYTRKADRQPAHQQGQPQTYSAPPPQYQQPPAQQFQPAPQQYQQPHYQQPAPQQQFQQPIQPNAQIIYAPPAGQPGFAQVPQQPVYPQQNAPAPPWEQPGAVTPPPPGVKEDDIPF
jgi:hypothetical protein